MDKLFEHWKQIRAHMRSHGMTGRIIVQLQSEDFDYHIAKSKNREQILKDGPLEEIEWFRCEKITFVRLPLSSNN